MITKTEIEGRNFRLYNSSLQSETNPIGNRDNYLAIHTNFFNNELILELSIFDNGLATITTYSEIPTKYREYFFIGNIETASQLDNIINSLKLNLSVIDFKILDTQ